MAEEATRPQTPTDRAGKGTPPAATPTDTAETPELKSARSPPTAAQCPKPPTPRLPHDVFPCRIKSRHEGPNPATPPLCFALPIRSTRLGGGSCWACHGPWSAVGAPHGAHAPALPRQPARYPRQPFCICLSAAWPGAFRGPSIQ